MAWINAVIRKFAGNPPQQWGKAGRAEFEDLPGEDAPAEFYEAFDRVNAAVFNNELERIPLRVNTPKFNSGFVSHYNDASRDLEFIGLWETFPQDREYMFEHMARHMAYVTRRPPHAAERAASPAPSLPAPVSPPPIDWDDYVWDEPVPPAPTQFAALTAPDVPLARWTPDLAGAVQPAPSRPDLEPLLTAAIQALARVQRSTPRQTRAVTAPPAVAPAGPSMEAMLTAIAQAMAVNQRPFIDVTPRAVAPGLLPSPAIESVFDITPGRAKTPTGRS